jgi:glucose/arabinose dehydrogenase
MKNWRVSILGPFSWHAGKTARLAIGVGLIAGACGSLRSVQGQTVVNARAEVIASGLSSPLFVTSAPGDNTRLFVVQQTGRVRVINVGGTPQAPTYSLAANPFLDLGALTSSGGERGFLGMAFAPDYQTSGYVYVSYTNPAGANVIARYTRSANDPSIVDPLSADVIFVLGQTSGIHHGGCIHFGSDGMLYAAIGDKARSADALNPNVLWGKMLRLDVSRDGFPADVNKDYAIPPENPFALGGGAPEVWARGLRNPWRWSFDRFSGDTWIGDVGAGQREEVNRVEGIGLPNTNYGWPVREGTVSTGASSGGFDVSNLTAPAHDYPRSVGSVVTGGYVYQGSQIRALRGRYVFADAAAPNLWSGRLVNGVLTDIVSHRLSWASGGVVNSPTIPSYGIVSFGQDNVGELYFTELQQGRVRKIVPFGVQPLIADLGSQGGVQGSDGQLDNNDFSAFVSLFFANDPRADVGAQGGAVQPDMQLDNNDFAAFIDAFFTAG